MSREPEANLRASYRLLITAARLVQRRQDEALAPLGLTRAAVIALEAAAPGPLNQEQLAAKVHVQSQTIGQVLTRLESQGLLKRTRNPSDRRQFQVKLTIAGKVALDAARRAEIDAFPTGMDAEGWAALQEQLTRFVDSLKGTPPGSNPDSHLSAPSEHTIPGNAAPLRRGTKGQAEAPATTLKPNEGNR